MKVIITTITLIYALSTAAQVTIGKVEQPPAPVAPKFIPKSLDSLSDFKTEAIFKNYTMYVGQLFYLPPKIERNSKMDDDSDNHSFKFYSTYPKKGNDPCDNYYKLINGSSDKKIKALLKNDRIYEYHTENYLQVNYLPNLLKPDYFVFRNEKDGDTLYWSPNNNGDFIFVPYFVKQKALYEKKIFMYEGPSDRIERDMVTNSFIYMTPNIKWTCKEVTLLKNSQVGGSAFNDKYVITYIFTNDKNETFAKTVNPFYPEVRDIRGDYHAKCFISEKEFIERELAKKQARNQDKQNLEKSFAELDQAEKDLRQAYIKKYGQANGDLIASGKVKIGMTKEMCLAAWGANFTPSKIVNNLGTLETWQYSIKKLLYFKDGILVQFEL